jgi:hypothetical protein
MIHIFGVQIPNKGLSFIEELLWNIPVCSVYLQGAESAVCYELAVGFWIL